MPGSSEKIPTYMLRPTDAEPVSRKQPAGDARLAWLRIAASWRLPAERVLAERTGGELLPH